MPTFTDLVHAVKPAVVSVRVKTESSAQSLSDNQTGNPFEGTPFEKFFKDFRGLAAQDHEHP
jgi:S1-C subfamily serine protease